MKKIALAFLLVVMMLSAVASVAIAQPANVIRKVGCSIYTGPYGGVVFDPEAQAVVTYSPYDNMQLTCKTELPEWVKPPKNVVYFNFKNSGMKCRTYQGITANWFSVITPREKVLLTCFMPDNQAGPYPYPPPYPPPSPTPTSSPPPYPYP